MKTKNTILTVSLVLILAATSLYAQAPQLINYQGKLNQGGAPANGSFSITFSVYSTETGGSSLWTEIQTVTAANGVFNVLLGSITSFPNDLFTASGERYLGIKVANDAEMSPRFRFASVAYAINPDGYSLNASDGSLTDVVFVDSTGNVGIGTTNPRALLHLDSRGNDVNDAKLYFTHSNDSTAAIQFDSGTNGFEFRVGGTSSSNTRLFIGSKWASLKDSLGIGTNNPQGTLHIWGPNTAGAKGRILFGDRNTPSNPLIGEYGEKDSDVLDLTGKSGIYLSTGIEDPLPVVMAINDSGRVGIGIGIRTPGSTLEVGGNVEAQGFTINGKSIGTSTDSFWSQDGNDIFYNNGNVGIGTTTPGAKLHIGGTAGVDGIMFPDGTLQTTAATGGNGAGDGHSLDAADGDPTDVVFVNNNGNVGIGTLSPDFTLDVAGELRIQGADLIIGTNDGRDIGSITDQRALVHFLDDELIVNFNGDFEGGTIIEGIGKTPNLFVSAAENGNVGIGTQTPEAKLHILDTSGDSFQMIRLETGENTALLGLNANNELQIIPPSGGTIFRDSGDTITRVVIKSEGIDAMLLGGRLVVNGAIFGKGLRFPGHFLPDTNFVGTEGNFIAFGDEGESEDFIGYKSNTFYFKDSPGGGDEVDPDVVFGGKVGIGTVTPGTINDVADGATVLSIKRATGAAGMDITGSGVARITLSDKDAGVNQKVIELRSSGGVFTISQVNDAITTKTEFITILNSGNVGIGFVEPDDRLEVHGARNLTGGSVVGKFASTDSSDGGVLIGGANDTGNRDGFIGPTTTTGALHFKVGNSLATTAMSILSDGNVGIGTTSPGAKLDIEQSGFANGFIRLNNTASSKEAVIGVVDAGLNPGMNALLFGFDEGSGTSGLGGATVLSGFGIQRTAANTLIVFTTQTGGQIRNVLDDGIGNVGIGTTEPTEKLHVVGNILATGTITPGSSREYKEEIEGLTIQESVQALDLLEPVTFYYKADKKKDLHMGFIAEDVPDLLATPDRKGVTTMDVVAVLTKVLQEQKKTIAEMQERIQALEERNK